MLVGGQGEQPVFMVNNVHKKRPGKEAAAPRRAAERPVFGKLGVPRSKCMPPWCPGRSTEDRLAGFVEPREGLTPRGGRAWALARGAGSRVKVPELSLLSFLSPLPSAGFASGFPSSGCPLLSIRVVCYTSLKCKLKMLKTAH